MRTCQLKALRAVGKRLRDQHGCGDTAQAGPVDVQPSASRESSGPVHLRPEIPPLGICLQIAPRQEVLRQNIHCIIGFAVKDGEGPRRRTEKLAKSALDQNAMQMFMRIRKNEVGLLRT